MCRCSFRNDKSLVWHNWDRGIDCTGRKGNNECPRPKRKKGTGPYVWRLGDYFH